MKRLILLLFCVFITPYCYAATSGDIYYERCVDVTGASITSCSALLLGTLRSDWELNCNTAGGAQYVNGIGVCSATSGSVGDAELTLNIDYTTAMNTNNKYCWCRLVVPESSAYVFGNSFTNWAACATNCAQYCGQQFATTPNFRSFIAGTIPVMYER